MQKRAEFSLSAPEGGEGEFCRRMREYRSSKGAEEISDRAFLAQGLDIAGA